MPGVKKRDAASYRKRAEQDQAHVMLLSIKVQSEPKFAQINVISSQSKQRFQWQKRNG
jgi:hypothetical protein